jgi:protein phosphatase
MGTTLSSVIVRRRSAVIGNVGDSRVYRVSRRRVKRLTTDHTLVAAMVESGMITAAQAQTHPDKHVLTQAIGTLGVLEPLMLRVRLPLRSRLLLCSDGLHDLVPEDEIGKLVREPDIEEAAKSLVARANALGGHDNVTVLIVEP